MILKNSLRSLDVYSGRYHRYGYHWIVYANNMPSLMFGPIERPASRPWDPALPGKGLSSMFWAGLVVLVRLEF